MYEPPHVSTNRSSRRPLRAGRGAGRPPSVVSGPGSPAPSWPSSAVDPVARSIRSRLPIPSPIISRRSRQPGWRPGADIDPAADRPLPPACRTRMRRPGHGGSRGSGVLRSSRPARNEAMSGSPSARRAWSPRPARTDRRRRGRRRCSAPPASVPRTARAGRASLLIDGPRSSLAILEAGTRQDDSPAPAVERCLQEPDRAIERR